MRIPSIYLPIDIELFDGHFKQFFEDFTHPRPDFLKHTLRQIKIGTSKIRYEIEFENLKPSNPPEPMRVICQVEAYVVSDHKIEMRSAALDMLTPDNRTGWGEVFLDEFYNMINLKWNVKPFFPNVEDSMDMPMNAARVQLYHDFGISEITSRKVPSTDDNEGNHDVKENTAPLLVIDDKKISRRMDDWYKALEEGLPPIEAIDEAKPSVQYQTLGPTLRTRERAKIIKEIKDSHPTMSYGIAAMEATKKLGEYISSDTVRNCYRAMGWKWERADRAR